MRTYKYTQSSPSAIYKRIPQCEEDHMRVCCSYADEIEYSAKVGIMEAMASGLLYTPDIIKYVMKKYKGHMNPAVVEEILGDPQISRVGPDPFTQLPHLPMNADTINIIIP